LAQKDKANIGGQDPPGSQKTKELHTLLGKEKAKRLQQANHKPKRKAHLPGVTELSTKEDPVSPLLGKRNVGITCL